MKAKYIFVASLLVAGAAFADTTTVDAEYVLGVFPVSVSAGETIINVPWVESGATGSGVAVSNLVKTAGLAVGDSILWYDTTNRRFDAWKVVLGEDETTKYWQATESIDSYGNRAFTAADATSLNKGQAIILKVASATTAYIVGQYSAGNGSGVDVAAGTVANPVYTLFAPPVVSGNYAVSNMNFSSTPNTKDEIWLANGAVLKYRQVSQENKNYQWKKYTTTDNGLTYTIDNNPTIPAGTGAWYVSRGGSPKITFN